MDSIRLDQKHKWEYLMASVKGSATRKTEGLGQISDNYPETIKILKSVYGRDELLMPLLWSELVNTKPVKANHENLGDSTDTLRAKTTAVSCWESQYHKLTVIHPVPSFSSTSCQLLSR